MSSIIPYIYPLAILTTQSDVRTAMQWSQSLFLPFLRVRECFYHYQLMYIRLGPKSIPIIQVNADLMIAQNFELLNTNYIMRQWRLCYAHCVQG